ncbi:YpzI family protein [Pontibacillus yanchengensis]|nr:YpzI family protein [Pontibacillus yanchengensis]
MGKDRQEKKLRKERRVESDRDTQSHPKGSTFMENEQPAKEKK